MLCSIKGRESYIILSVWVNVCFSNKITFPLPISHIICHHGSTNALPHHFTQTLSDIKKKKSPGLMSLSENKEIQNYSLAFLNFTQKYQLLIPLTLYWGQTSCTAGPKQGRSAQPSCSSLSTANGSPESSPRVEERICLYRNSI